ncbi:MAG: hypothetical protein ACREE7_03355 [Dongiaceae bacterium]
MFQVYVDDADRLLAAVSAEGWPIHAGPREVWRRYGDHEGGQREFFLLDSDGSPKTSANDRYPSRTNISANRAAQP